MRKPSPWSRSESKQWIAYSYRPAYPQTGTKYGVVRYYGDWEHERDQLPPTVDRYDIIIAEDAQEALQEFRLGAQEEVLAEASAYKVPGSRAWGAERMPAWPRSDRINFYAVGPGVPGDIIVHVDSIDDPGQVEYQRERNRVEARDLADWLFDRLTGETNRVLLARLEERLER